MRKVIAHGHIFKNAGSTFDWSLQRNFADSFLDHREDGLMRKQGAAHVRELLNERPGLEAFSSHHLCNPLPELEGVDIQAVFFLRHPIARIDSVYRFERQQDADTPGARMAKQKSFANYVAWRMQANVAHTIRNYQTCYLAGVHEHPEEGTVGLGIFGQAMSTLRSSAFVGMVERYDESMVVLENLLRADWPLLDLSYVRQNVSARRWFRRDQGGVNGVLSRLGKQAQTVLDHNSLDLALYQLAQRQLDDHLASIPDLEQRLADFRRRCQSLEGEA